MVSVIRRSRPLFEYGLLGLDPFRGIGHGGSMLANGSERVYLHHVRKTGGTSLARSFIALGGEASQAVEQRIKDSFLQRATSGGLTYAMGLTPTLNGGNYLFGWSHIPAFMLNLPPKTFTVTVLRDPVARFVSYYRCLVADEEPGLVFRASREEREMAARPFADFLDLVPQRDLLRQLYTFSKSFDVNEAVEAIRGCSLVFTTENYAEGVAVLGDRLGLDLAVRFDRTTEGSRFNPEVKDLERLAESLEPEYRMMTDLGFPVKCSWLERDALVSS